MRQISSPKFAIVLFLLLIIRTCKTTTTTLAKNGYFHPATAPGASNYYASSVATVWVIAAQDCLAILGANGTLLNIETQVESDWISEWLDSRGAMVGRYWTSGSATGVGQEWYWTGNQGADFAAYTNWGVGQPDSSNARRRLALNYSPAEDISTTTPAPTTTFKPGRGPYSFDYLLGVTTFVETGGDFVFIDYDLPLNVIWQYRAARKTVMCHVDVGLWEMWRPDADNFPSRVLGNVAWLGERWLDIRNTDVILPWR
ncbi:hypothetical protein Fcan01_28019 [Folsomia candida]|uniref:C-type lectin domain-containing protein n=1 Tax=Folsomia candida TaxID=158441 RepID=A0A226CX64_FOLCA|nr:hypothetical protein Fcan01_28019 [Folsomia candida]